MGEEQRDGSRWLARATQRAKTESVRAQVTSSIRRVSRLPSQVGELSGRAAGILTRKDLRSVRLRLLFTTVCVALIAALVAAVGNFLSLPHTPEESADRYMSALVEGDYLAGIDGAAYSRFDYTYLSNPIYRASPGRVESYRITGSQQTGDGRGSVGVLATVDGQERELTLPFSPVERTGPFNDTWQLATPAQSFLTLTSPVDLARVQVNGRELDLPASRRTFTPAGYRWVLPALPGSYSFSLPSTSYYTVSQDVHTVTAPLPGTGEEQPELNLQVRPSPRMWREVDGLISSWLRRCESARRLDVAGCPVPAGPEGKAATNISNLTWKLLDRLALYLVPDASDPRVWRAARDKPAAFEVTYLADGKAHREIVTFYIRAEVISDGTQAEMKVGLEGSEEDQAHLRQTITDEENSKPSLQKFAASF